MTTLIASPEALERDSLTVEGEPHRHLFRASRLGPGAQVRVVDGCGSARWATVTTVTRRSAELALGDRAPTREPGRVVEVFVAPPKIGRARWMVEKLTEVGVSAIRIWATERGSRSYGASNLERLRRIAGAAVEQCERSRVPHIEAHTWSQGLERLKGVPRRWLLAPGAASPPRPALDDDGALAILVGPEGGWTAGERAAISNLPALEVGLGPTVLRIETAAVAAASVALLG